MNVTYKILPEQRRVVALTPYDGKMLHGVAKCNELDAFDENLGKEIAFLRVKKSSLKARKADFKIEKEYYEKLAKNFAAEAAKADKEIAKINNKLIEITEAIKKIAK